MTELLDTDAVELSFLVASLDVLKEWGVTAPNMSERVARENGEPKKATERAVEAESESEREGT